MRLLEPRLEPRIDVSNLIDQVVKVVPDLSDKLEAIFKKGQQAHAEEAKKYQKIGPLFTQITSHSLPYTFCHLEKELAERRKPRSKRDRGRQISPGTQDFDENKTIVAIAKMAGLPDEIPENIPEATKQQYLRMLTIEMANIESGLRNGHITPQTLNDTIDNIIPDTVYDFMQNVFDVPQQKIPELKKSIDKIFGANGLNIAEFTAKIKEAVIGAGTDENNSNNEKPKNFSFIKWFLKSLV